MSTTGYPREACEGFAASRCQLEAECLINGRFRLVRALGQGALGIVWLAEDERLDEPVALKFFRPSFEGKRLALDDLRHETARSHRLSHPNIIRIFDYHDSDWHGPFISMEYAQGMSLEGLQRARADLLLGWEFLHPILLQLCDALGCAHGENVIHRDLKPANLILDGRGRLKLADLGIAAIVNDSTVRISLTRKPTGTLHYMSPQQLSGLTPQLTDDFYSLGATLYDLLTGHPPFFQGDIAHHIRETMPEPPTRRLRRFGLVNRIPPHIEALIMACISKHPLRRPQSSAAIIEWIGPDMRLRGVQSTLRGVRARLRGWFTRMSSISQTHVRPGGQSI